MKNRLTQLLLNLPANKKYVDGICVGEQLHTAESIADYLLLEGVVVPKFKIGDKLYGLSASKTRLFEWTITHFELYKDDIKIYGKKPQWRETEWICWQSDLGNNEWVFATKEEAEQALKEAVAE